MTSTVQFFTQFEGMEQGFRARAARADELLRSHRTSFALVCSPRRDTVDEALLLAPSCRDRYGSRDGRRQPLLHRARPGHACGRRTGRALAPLLVNLAELRAVGAKKKNN